MLYRDKLNNLEARATISVYGTSYGRVGTGHLELTTTSNAPTKKWAYISKNVDKIVAEMNVRGWDCVKTIDGYNAPIINMLHRDTQAAINVATKAADNKFYEAERGYIRFGDMPQNGLSKNHRDNTFEAGVSVYNAEYATDHTYRLLLSNDGMYGEAAHIANRPAYRVWGEEVGIGSDGEPVLRVKKYKKINLAK